MVGHLKSLRQHWKSLAAIAVLSAFLPLVYFILPWKPGHRPHWLGSTSSNRVSVTQALTYVDTLDFATQQTEEVSLRYEVGREYGWRLFFRSHNERIDFEIEDTVNGKPEDLNWLSPEDKKNVTANGRTKMPITMDPAWNGDGHIGMKYVMEDGDELGIHEINVFVEGKLIQTFSFRVHED